MFLMAVISFYVFISSAHKDFQSISFSRHSKMQNLSLTPLTPQQSQLRPTDIDLQYAVGNPISDDYLNSNTTNFSFSNALLYEPQSTFTSTSSVSDFPNSFDSEEVIGINAFEGLTPEQLFGSSTFTDPLADRTSASRFGSDFSGVFQPETQLVVVDSGVENWEQLVSDLSTNGSDSYEIVLLDQNSSGLDQITAAVQRFDRLGAIHIISHGDGSGFQLGNERITGDLSADDIGQIASWKNHLLADADLLIYGCDLASTESGRGLVTTLGELTGADVAASDDLTGNAAFGADWDLEFQTGSIDRFGALQALARSNWEGYLGTVNITQAWLDAQDTNGGPYVLDSANTNYVLQTDVTTSGTAFGITARNVTFDLNGHTITYNDSAPISVANHSFENGTGTAIEDWTFSAGATGERFRGEYLENTVYDGDHSLRFGITDGDQFARSNGTVTLSANTQYSLSSLFYYDQPGNSVAGNPGAEIYVRLESTTSDRTYEVVWDQTNWRGIQHTEKTFTTSGASESFRIFAGVRHDTSIASRYAIIDDIKIQKHRTYGVTVSVHNWARSHYPGFDEFGWGHDATIKNGTIKQGRDNGTWSHGVFIHNTPNATIENVNITVQGANASAILGRDNATNMTIRNNEFTSNVQTISSRDNFHAAVLKNVSGVVSGNKIHNGPHGGIFARAGTVIHDNEIRLKAKYTNAFAIVGGQEIYNNVIDNATGEYNSRGIGVGGGSAENPKKVYNNTISVQGLENNQEYFGAQPGGAYGIQAEGGGHVEIYGNTVNVVAEFSEGYAFRMNETEAGADIYVHDNIFRATRVGTEYDTAPVRFSEVVSGTLRFEDNVLESNDQFVGHSTNVDQIELKGSTLRAFGDTTGFKALESFNWQGNNVTSVRDLVFVDNEYADSATRQLLVDSPFHNFLDGTDNASSFISRFNTTFRALDDEGQPLADTSVKVFDKNDKEVFSGTTNADGTVETPLDEFRTQGANKTSNGPFKVRLESNGEIEEVEFTADQVQTIDVQIGGGGGTDDDFSFNYNGSVLDVIGNDSDDHFEWSAANPLVLTIDGKNFDLESGISRIRIFGRGGTDTITATGSSGDDTLIAVPAGSLFRTQALDFQFTETENHNISGGSGGVDTLNLTDSAGDEHVTIGDLTASITSGDWQLNATGFENQIARSLNGGNDSIEFLAYEGTSTLIGNGDRIAIYSGDQFKLSFGFDTTEVDARGTGNRAFLNDSALDDTFTIDNLSLDLTNEQYSVSATGFQIQNVNSITGGSDSATLYSRGDNGLAFSASGFTAIINDGNFARVNDFASTTVFGSGTIGELAFVRDSAGDDSYLAHAEGIRVEDAGSVRRFNGFTASTVIFSTGDDQVEFAGSAADDAVGGNTSQLRFTNSSSFNHFVRGFDSAQVDGGGGNDVITLLDSAGDDQLTVTQNGLTFANANSEVVVDNFRTQFVSSVNGGRDSVTFIDSINDDSFISDSNATIMRNSTGFFSRATGFNSVTVNQAFDSDNDRLELIGSQSADHFVFSGSLASVTDGTRTRDFNGINSVFATWNSLEDSLDRRETDYSLELTDSSGNDGAGGNSA